MGKRIFKSRKHKKLKSVDPFNSAGISNLERRKVENVNKVPENVDDQEVPLKMKEFITAKNLAKHYSLKKRKKKRKNNLIIVRKDKLEEEQPGMIRPLKPLPDKVKQHNSESEGMFLRRLQRLASNAIVEAGMEQKYDVDVVVDKKGEVIIMSEKQRSSKRNEKRKMKEQMKKEKKKLKLDTKIDDFSHLQDVIPFGEVALHPPDIQAKIRKPKVYAKPFVHKKDSSEIYSSAAGKKKLSIGERRIFDNERKQIVDMYRQLKKKKALKNI